MVSDEAVRLRDRATELLALPALAFPSPEGRRPAWDEWVTIDSYKVHHALQCAASLDVPKADYIETVRNTRRRIGLATLRLHRDRTDSTLHDCATAVVEGNFSGSEIDDLSTNLRSWIENSDPAVRAAVIAGGATWASSAAALVHPHDVRSTRFSDAKSNFVWVVPNSTLRLQCRSEAVSRDRMRLLVIVDRDPSPTATAHDAAWVALVYTLCSGALPTSVAVRNVRTGEHDNHVPTPSMFDTALDHAWTTADALAVAVRGGGAAETPGRWCAWCLALPDCPSGTSWMSRVST
jgi:hypothetical protein